MTRQEKQQIEAALIAAKDNTIKEQVIHRERISIMEKCGNKDYLMKPLTINWNNINEAMADECYPANCRNRETILEQNRDEAPSRILIDQIEDKDIRGRVYFLNEFVEHCHRIKASAKFFEVLNADPEDSFSYLLFKLWSANNVYLQLAREQLEAGNQEKAKDLQQVAEAAGKVFDILIKDPEALKHKLKILA